MINITSSDIREGVVESKHTIYCCLHGGKHFNLGGFKMTMTKAWHCDDFKIQRVDQRIYQLFFGTFDVVEFIMDNGLWHFENHIFLLQPWKKVKLSL